jgi:hypothetical protein
VSNDRSIEKKRSEDRAFEDKHGIRHHDPIADRYGGKVYSPSDSRAIEQQRMPPRRRRTP